MTINIATIQDRDGTWSKRIIPAPLTNNEGWINLNRCPEGTHSVETVNSIAEAAMILQCTASEVERIIEYHELAQHELNSL